MSVKETMIAMADASDANVPKVAVFRPSITNATRKKNGDTTITLKVVTNEFTCEDVLNGIVAWLALGTFPAVEALQAPKGSADGAS
jgi:hypothetical protein